MIEIDGKKRNVCAWIPARGGSKGVPGKALRDLGGKPLIAHTIEAARDISGVDIVCVNTDDETIRDVALSCGAEAPFLRPAELGGDTARLEDAVKYQWEWYRQNRQFSPDIHIGMSPTYPFRRKGRIDQALQLIRDIPSAFNVRSLVHVNHSADNFWIMEDHKLQRFTIPGGPYHPYNPLLHDCFSFNVVVDCRQHIPGIGPTPMVISDIESVDIDEMPDYRLAQCIVESGLWNEEGCTNKGPVAGDASFFGKSLTDFKFIDDKRILVHPDFPMITMNDIEDFASFCAGKDSIVVSGCGVNISRHPYRLMKRHDALFSRYAVDIPQDIRGYRQMYPKVVHFVPALVYLPDNLPEKHLYAPDQFGMYCLPPEKCLDSVQTLDFLQMKVAETSGFRGVHGSMVNKSA